MAPVNNLILMSNLIAKVNISSAQKYNNRRHSPPPHEDSRYTHEHSKTRKPEKQHGLFIDMKTPLLLGSTSCRPLPPVHDIIRERSDIGKKCAPVSRNREARRDSTPHNL